MTESKQVVIQTDQGQVIVSADFSLDNNQPIHGFVRIIDNIDKRIYWFNVNAISWIGPPQ